MELAGLEPATSWVRCGDAIYADVRPGEMLVATIGDIGEHKLLAQQPEDEPLQGPVAAMGELVRAAQG